MGSTHLLGITCFWNKHLDKNWDKNKDMKCYEMYSTISSIKKFIISTISYNVRDVGLNFLMYIKLATCSWFKWLITLHCFLYGIIK